MRCIYSMARFDFDEGVVCCGPTGCLFVAICCSVVISVAERLQSIKVVFVCVHKQPWPVCEMR